MTSDTTGPESFEFELTPCRSSELFGSRMKFLRSTAFNFHPDTLLRACTGYGLQSHLEESPQYKTFLSLKAFARSVETGSKMQRQSKLDAETGMATVRYKGREARPQDLVDMPESHAAPWRQIWRGMRHPDIDVRIRRLFARFAAFDRAAHQISRQLDPEAHVALRRRHMEDTIRFWSSSGFAINPWAAVALDATLQHLAWLDSHEVLELRLASFQGALPLAEDSRSPMRHWFDELLSTANFEDLTSMAKYLEVQSERGVSPKITAQALRNWASSQFLMSLESGRDLLQALVPKIQPDREYYRLTMARLLVFLVEVARCFSKEPVAEEAARVVIYSRLRELELRARAT